VVREERERLDVEEEVLRRALHPEGGVALRGEPVVSAVHLDDGELLGVEAQPLFGRLDLRRVEAAAGHQAVLRPGAGADQDARCHRRPPVVDALAGLPIIGGADRRAFGRRAGTR
jgi:hypothetical protein